MRRPSQNPRPPCGTRPGEIPGSAAGKADPWNLCLNSRAARPKAAALSADDDIVYATGTSVKQRQRAPFTWAAARQARNRNRCGRAPPSRTKTGMNISCTLFAFFDRLPQPARLGDSWLKRERGPLRAWLGCGPTAAYGHYKTARASRAVSRKGVRGLAQRSARSMRTGVCGLAYRSARACAKGCAGLQNGVYALALNCALEARPLTAQKETLLN